MKILPALALLWSTSVGAQLRATALNDHLTLLQTPSSNLVADVGPEGAVLVGAVDTSSAKAIADWLQTHTASPRRYVLAMIGLTSRGQADAGWDARGALVIMQEFGVRRMERVPAPGLRRPRAEFSQFFSIELNGEPMHAVRQEPGYASSDVLVHFENSSIVYLGESYPGDGYPRIDAALGGTIDGLLKTLEPWVKANGIKFVGARGEMATADDIASFREMLTAVRDRVQRSKQAGQSVEQVLAAHPTAEYDARWGRGVTSSDAFVRNVYALVR